MKRVMVFGIDGGMLSLVEKWRDDLPTFRMFMDEGAYGVMRSTTPPLTCPAWACMFTGKNPGKLGMFDFVSLDGKAKVHNLTDYYNSSLWKILTEDGRTVGLLNVPMTYPPHVVNGFIVSGLGTPEMSGVRYTYPPELEERLGDYRIMPNVLLTIPNQEKKCLRSVSKVLEGRVKTAAYLLREFSCDLFVCVFSVSDVVQHYFWRFMDKEHPRHENIYDYVIKDVYQLIDRAIGELMEEDAAVLLVSDHGFAPCHGTFGVNKWLEEEGYLRYKGNLSNDMLYKVRDCVVGRLHPAMVRRIVRWMPGGLRGRMNTSGESRSKSLDLLRRIDWDESSAYAIGAASGGIFLLDYGVRLEIASKLEHFGFKCLLKEDVYNGPYTRFAPDRFIELGSSPYYPMAFAKSIWNETAISGSHYPDGMFMACNAGISSGKRDDLSIYDVAPTILHLMGHTVPGDMDGRIIL